MIVQKSPRIVASSYLLRKVILNILGKNINSIVPRFNPESGFLYDEPNGLNLTQQIQILNTLENQGGLTRSQVQSFLRCNDCYSPYILVRLSCSLCKSNDIGRGRVIEHLPCGHINFDSKFLSSAGILICPKCNKRLNALGIDYSKPGIYYQCMDCKAMLPKAEEIYQCMSCGHSSSYDDLGILQIPAYVVNREKLAYGLGNAEYLNSLVQMLKAENIKYASPGYAIGKSKIQHNFSLLVLDDKNASPFIAADILIASEADQSEEMQVISLFAKCMDATILHKFLFSTKPIDENAKSLANAYGIHLFENIADDDSITSVFEMIRRVMPKTSIKG